MGPRRRIVLDTDNELFKSLHPLLLDIFCKGVLNAESRRLATGAGMGILFLPFSIPSIIAFNAINILILLLALFLLNEQIAALGPLGTILIAGGFLAVFYRDIHAELENVFLNLLILLTGGGFLRWVCKGYLSHATLRQKLLVSRGMERVTAYMIVCTPVDSKANWDYAMDLYLESNKPKKEAELRRFIEGYWDPDE